MAFNDGGPAFPQLDVEVVSDTYAVTTARGGMSLRDYFAAAALRVRYGDGTAMTQEDAAAMAYQLADAMIAEREKRHAAS